MRHQSSTSFDGAIDFLFIDGDHSFYWVLEDITTLSRFLKKDSIVAFHDYSIHNYGIKIVVEALKRHGALKNLLKLHSLALGIFNPEAGLPNLNTYIDVARDSIFTPLDYINRWERTTESWADNCASMLFSLPNLKDVKFIGRGLRGWLLQTLLGLPDDMFINSDQANNAEQTYIILSGMWKEISTSLILAKELPIYNVKALSNFAISKLMYQDMLGGRKKINRFARSQFELDFFDGLFGGMPEHELFHLHNNGTLLAFFEGMFPDRVVSPLDRFTDTNARP